MSTIWDTFILRYCICYVLIWDVSIFNLDHDTGYHLDHNMILIYHVDHNMADNGPQYGI